MSNYLDITGERYGKLVAIEYVGKHKGKSAWKCQCDCGNTIIVPSNSLRTYNTRSCGCIINKHGGSKTRLVVSAN